MSGGSWGQEPWREDDQLETLKKMAGSYELLFSRTAQKYKELGLKEQTLSESDYKNFLLTEYTFLKRPVCILGDEIFIGNKKGDYCFS